MYGGLEELIVNGYTDVACQTDVEDSKSQSGFVFCLNRGAVSWKRSKQDTVADSTTESAYIAASEATWIRSVNKNTTWYRVIIVSYSKFCSMVL